MLRLGQWPHVLGDHAAQDVDEGRDPRHGHLVDAVGVNETPAQVGDHVVVGREARKVPLDHWIDVHYE